MINRNFQRIKTIAFLFAVVLLGSMGTLFMGAQSVLQTGEKAPQIFPQYTPSTPVLAELRLRDTVKNRLVPKLDKRDEGVKKLLQKYDKMEQENLRYQQENEMLKKELYRTKARLLNAQAQIVKDSDHSEADYATAEIETGPKEFYLSNGALLVVAPDSSFVIVPPKKKGFFNRLFSKKHKR